MNDLLVWVDCEMTGLDLGRDALKAEGWAPPVDQAVDFRVTMEIDESGRDEESSCVDLRLAPVSDPTNQHDPIAPNSDVRLRPRATGPVIDRAVPDYEVVRR